MRRFSAILFLTLYLTGTTEASQLLKLPVIIEHFQEHRQNNQNISFLEFLDMHYMHGSPHDDDYDRDMQLPFKKANQHLTITQVTIPAVPVLLQEKIEIISPTFPTVTSIVLYSQYRHSIFQPPRA